MTPQLFDTWTQAVYEQDAVYEPIFLAFAAWGGTNDCVFRAVKAYAVT